ncbi:MAG: peptide ligase PGM1-related protein [Acidimicrobiia bacterium]
MDEFGLLQTRLAEALERNVADSTEPHVVVVLPSFSVGESLLSHYASRLPALEHRFLGSLFMLRFPAVRVLYVCSAAPSDDVVDHYLSLMPPDMAATVRDRFRIVVVDDASARAVASKLLDRPDLIEAIRSWIGDDPAHIEPWNVAAPEMEVALRLGVPINGTSPTLWPLGFKSSGRTIFRDAGVPVPAGFEHLETVDQAVDAIDRLRTERPAMASVILKHDDSGAGDGNAVIRVDDLEPAGSVLSRRRLRSRVNSLDSWYIDDLRLGFVVEERIAGTHFSSPSAQIDLAPDGAVRVLSTHEQVLGDDGQVYLGCVFPADAAYAADLGTHATAAGRALAERGVIGRVAVDFVTSADDDGPWRVHALEANIRKGGTTHPFTVLRHLAPGAYDPATGRYTDDRGRQKSYVASDNLHDERCTGIGEGEVIAALGTAGLLFDPDTRTGVVPHMLSCLAIDGRFGVTAIGDSGDQASQLFDAVAEAITAGT